MKPGANSVQPHDVVTPTAIKPSPAPPRINRATSLNDGGGGSRPIGAHYRRRYWPSLPSSGRSIRQLIRCLDLGDRAGRRAPRGQVDLVVEHLPPIGEGSRPRLRIARTDAGRSVLLFSASSDSAARKAVNSSMLKERMSGNESMSFQFGHATPRPRRPWAPWRVGRSVPSEPSAGRCSSIRTEAAGLAGATRRSACGSIDPSVLYPHHRPHQRTRPPDAHATTAPSGTPGMRDETGDNFASWQPQSLNARSTRPGGTWRLPWRVEVELAGPGLAVVLAGARPTTDAQLPARH